MTTIHYVTEMVEAATGKLIERKLLTVKSSNAAKAVMARIQADHKSSYRRGAFRCTITKMWAA
jgi:folate-dependent phosphoribosylglycinamide formyltransferase PurN